MDKLIKKLEENGIMVDSVEALCEQLRSQGYDPESLNTPQINQIVSDMVAVTMNAGGLTVRSEQKPAKGRGRKPKDPIKLDVQREQMPSDFKPLTEATNKSVANINQFEEGFHEGLDQVVATPVNRMLSRVENLDVEVVRAVIDGAAQLGGDKDPAFFRSAGRDFALAALFAVSSSEAE